MPHTPGPWFVYPQDIENNPLQFSISGTQDGWPTDPICWFGANRTEGENKANAKAILKTPDLIAALARVYAEVEDHTAAGRTSLSPDLRATIRKLLRGLDCLPRRIPRGDTNEIRGV